MPNADVSEQTAGAYLLENLFGDPHKRGSISNARYFDRYFSYTTSPDDIKDTELQHFVSLCDEVAEENASALLSELILRNAMVLIGRLRAFAGQLSQETTGKLVRTLAHHGAFFDAFPVSKSTSARTAAGTLIAELVLNCPGSTEQRGALALEILNEADPLPLALLIYRGLVGADVAGLGRYYDDTVDPLLPESSALDLRASLVDRISVSAQTHPPYEEFEEADALSFLVLWNQERPEELRAYVTNRTKTNPSEAARILNVTGNLGWGNYQFLVWMVDIESFNEALDIHYSPILARGEWTSELSLLSDFRSYLKIRSGSRQSLTSPALDQEMQR
jgi:hypothetical protein